MKSRLQAGNLKYKSSLDGLMTIIKEEGIEGLYKGIGSKIVQSVLTAAILFAGQRRIFEMTKKVRSCAVSCSDAVLRERTGNLSVGRLNRCAEEQLYFPGNAVILR